MASTFVDLELLFRELNETHFDGFLDPLRLKWNTRLRSSAGRFHPGRRKFLSQAPPMIEIASYLMEEPRARELIADTMGHEMIHYWLWVRRRPYGHTDEFWAKMKAMGVSRYNSTPAVKAHKYVYECPACIKQFKAKRRLKGLACSACCKLHNGGKFHERFRLRLHAELTPVERKAERARLLTEKRAESVASVVEPAAPVGGAEV